MRKQPWYETTPLHLMDSNPRDEYPEGRECKHCGEVFDLKWEGPNGECPKCGKTPDDHSDQEG